MCSTFKIALWSALDNLDIQTSMMSEGNIQEDCMSSKRKATFWLKLIEHSIKLSFFTASTINN